MTLKILGDDSADTVELMRAAIASAIECRDLSIDSGSPGHFAILNQINESRKRDLDYLYLGYWIRDCNKMSYKRRYKPLEAYLNEQWVALD